MSLASKCAALPVVSRRLIALIVVPLFVWMISLAVYLPATSLRDSHEQWRATARRLLSHAKHAPDAQVALEREITAIRSSALWSKFYPATTSVPAATLLHADVGALLAGVQASSQQLTPIAAEESPSFTRLGVRVAVSLRINQLQDLLAAAARSSRFLHVEHLTVVAPHMQLPDENPPLAVTMDIFAYALPRDAAAPTTVAFALGSGASP